MREARRALPFRRDRATSHGRPARPHRQGVILSGLHGRHAVGAVQGRSASSEPSSMPSNRIVDK